MSDLTITHEDMRAIEEICCQKTHRGVECVWWAGFSGGGFHVFLNQVGYATVVCDNSTRDDHDRMPGFVVSRGWYSSERAVVVIGEYVLPGVGWREHVALAALRALGIYKEEE